MTLCIYLHMLCVLARQGVSASACSSASPLLRRHESGTTATTAAPAGVAPEDRGAPAPLGGIA